MIIETDPLAMVDSTLADEVVNLGATRTIVVGAPGLMVSTGIGDGRYPVDVLYTDVEGAGRRIAAVQVTFLEHEHEDEDG